MADIGHGRHSPAGDLYLDDLAPIQITFSFIGIELDETDWIDVEEEAPADKSAGLWEDKRIP
jgi:hypothetical protein